MAQLDNAGQAVDSTTANAGGGSLLFLAHKDALDADTFNVVDFINTLFPNEQSLSNIDAVIDTVQDECSKLESEIHECLVKQAFAPDSSQAALIQAQKEIARLASQVREIRDLAEKTEDNVQEITKDIKKLDIAKRNLTISITTLNQLHMLVGGVENLSSMVARKQYSEIAPLLQGIQNVCESFRKYSTTIKEVGDLLKRVDEIQTTLGDQVLHDIKEALAGKQPIANQALSSALKIVASLDRKVRDHLIEWHTDILLQEYKALFQESEDDAWLDKVDKRFAWLRQCLIEFETKYGALFPIDWEMSERITLQFCTITYRHLSNLMRTRRDEIDIKLFLFASQKTLVFEDFLTKRFATSLHLRKGEEWRGAIAATFEDNIDIYITAQDANLSELIGRFGDDLKKNGLPNAATAALSSATTGGAGSAAKKAPSSAQAVSTATAGDESMSMVIPSCADLFVFYKKCMMQVSSLSFSGQALVALSTVFKRHLANYANRVLRQNLPKNAASSTAGIIQQLLREGELSFGPKMTTDEQQLVCAILTTSEYALETTTQLAEKLLTKLDSFPAPQPPTAVNRSTLCSFTHERELFDDLIQTCISLLCTDLQAACEPALSTMLKLQWSTIESVGDQSPWCAQIVTHLRNTVPVLRNHLTASRKHFTQFCLQFVDAFISRYLAQLYKCKMLSTAGAEQLLLDSHILKTVLLEMPSLGLAISRKPPASFTKIVVKGMTHVEMILKLIMSPTNNNSATGGDAPRQFVETAARLVPEMDFNEYQKVLEMKGVKRAQVQAYLDAYHKYFSKPQQQPLQTTLAATDTATFGGSGNSPAAHLGGAGSSPNIAVRGSPSEKQFLSSPGGGDSAAVIMSTSPSSTTAMPITGKAGAVGGGAAGLSSSPGGAAVAAAGSDVDAYTSGIRKLEKLIKKRL